MDWLGIVTIRHEHRVSLLNGHHQGLASLMRVGPFEFLPWPSPSIRAGYKIVPNVGDDPRPAQIVALKCSWH